MISKHYGLFCCCAFTGSVSVFAQTRDSIGHIPAFAQSTDSTNKPLDEVVVTAYCKVSRQTKSDRGKSPSSSHTT